MRKTLLIAGALACTFLTGCAPAPQTRWAWNNYQDNLYNYHQQQMTDKELYEALLGAEQEASNRGVRLAPGLYAEIGTICMKLGGSADEVCGWYRKEAALWPESEPFMNSLIEGIERNQKNLKGDGK